MQLKAALTRLVLTMGLIRFGQGKIYLQKCRVQGNLDPLSLLNAGTEMFRDIDHILDAFHDRPHIFNLGHGITPPTPVENVQKMIDHIRNR